MADTALRVTTVVGAGPPSSGLHEANEVTIDGNGAIWSCTVTGTPGTWVALGIGPPSSASFAAPALEVTMPDRIDLPVNVRATAADIAAQNPAMQQRITGLLEGMAQDTTRHWRLVIDAAHLEADTVVAAIAENGKRPAGERAR
jgi:hypothetical protein